MPNLILNRYPSNRGLALGAPLTELLLDGNDTPARIREAVERHLGARCTLDGWERFGTPRTENACTFSLVAIEHWVYVHRKLNDGAMPDDLIATIFYASPGGDVPVSLCREAAWFNHFSLSELYGEGYFEWVTMDPRPPSVEQLQRAMQEYGRTEDGVRVLYLQVEGSPQFQDSIPYGHENRVLVRVTIDSGVAWWGDPRHPDPAVHLSIHTPFGALDELRGTWRVAEVRGPDRLTLILPAITGLTAGPWHPTPSL